MASHAKSEISNNDLRDSKFTQNKPLPAPSQAFIESSETVSTLPLDGQADKIAVHPEDHPQTALSSRGSLSSVSPGKKLSQPSSSKGSRKPSIHPTEPVLSLNPNTGGIAIRRLSSTREELASQLPEDYFQQLQTPANSDTEKEGPGVEKASVRKVRTYSYTYSESQLSRSELGEDEEAEFDDACESVFSYSGEETAKTKVGTHRGSAKTSGVFVPRIHATNAVHKPK
ncbi:hypothetical protein ACO0QE_003949 [Hanseniaspora vineae]